LCHALRHEGVDYGDYLDQLANLIALRTFDAFATGAGRKALWSVPETRVVAEYDARLRALGKGPQPARAVFEDAENLIRDPTVLRSLMVSIDQACDANASELLSATFEELVERAGAEGKKGAGQYFTPRVVGDVIAAVMRPWPTQPGEFLVADPAAGVGGFLVAAHRARPRRARSSTAGEVHYFGTEIARRPRRLGLMNLLLHGMPGTIELDDALKSNRAHLDADVILTNPPFGVRGGSGPPSRSDFWYRTTNKQLNFLQHVVVNLKEGGRAAVVLPDSVIGSPSLAAVWDPILSTCDVHTLLRLSDRTFAPYAPSIRTVVIFLTKGRTSERTWIFDARAPAGREPAAFQRDPYAEFVQSFGRNPTRPSASAREKTASAWWYGVGSADVFLREKPLQMSSPVDADPLDAEQQMRDHFKRARYELEAAMEAVERMWRPE
jgi:type I restriction enzyme M protein